MAKQKTKSASKKVVGAKTTARTGSAVSSTAKTVKSATTATAKKAAVKKTSAAIAESDKTKTPAKKTATGKTSPPAAANKATAKPTPAERYRMVETAAYYIAEQHGFQGRSDEHWAAAERAIALKLGQ